MHTAVYVCVCICVCVYLRACVRAGGRACVLRGTAWGGLGVEDDSWTVV